MSPAGGIGELVQPYLAPWASEFQRFSTINLFSPTGSQSLITVVPAGYWYRLVSATTTIQTQPSGTSLSLSLSVRDNYSNRFVYLVGSFGTPVLNATYNMSYAPGMGDVAFDDTLYPSRSTPDMLIGPGGQFTLSAQGNMLLLANTVHTMAIEQYQPVPGTQTELEQSEQTVLPTVLT